MARACSDDLRTRVVAAVGIEGLSQRDVARRFILMPGTVTKWVQRGATNRQRPPAKMGGRQPKKLSGGQGSRLLARCSNGDFTLRDLVVEMAAQGLTISYRPVWALVHAEGRTHRILIRIVMISYRYG